jgi:hyperosmotically inducible periplasmic protein
MNSQTSRKLIVAGGLAAVVVTGVVIFALRSPATSVAHGPPPSAASEIPGAPPVAGAQTPGAPPVAGAQTPGAPPVAGAQTPGAPPASAAQTPPAAPPAVAQIPAAPAAVAEIPDTHAAIAHKDRVATKSADTATASAAEPKLARNRHPAKAATSAVATNDTVTRTGSAADTSEKTAAETVANSVDSVKSADELTTPPAPSSPPSVDQKVATGTAEFAASDSQITTDVKSQIAGDSLSKDVNIGVTTTHGVVALTGKLASQDAIDHVKDVAGKVKDVKSVDGSALILASL